jgi:hypothetical protein
MNRRQWHIAFCAAAGYRVTSRMSDRDTSQMNAMRDEGRSPQETAGVIRAMVNARWAVIR